MFYANLSIKIYWSHCGHVKHGSWFLDCFFFFLFLFILHRNFTDLKVSKSTLLGLKKNIYKKDSILASHKGSSLPSKCQKMLDVLKVKAAIQIGHGLCSLRQLHTGRLCSHGIGSERLKVNVLKL